jgi:hypothetical protein
MVHTCSTDTPRSWCAHWKWNGVQGVISQMFLVGFKITDVLHHSQQQFLHQHLTRTANRSNTPVKHTNVICTTACNSTAKTLTIKASFELYLQQDVLHILNFWTIYPINSTWHDTHLSYKDSLQFFHCTSSQTLLPSSLPPSKVGDTPHC